MSHPRPDDSAGAPPAGLTWRRSDDAASAFAIHRIATANAAPGIVRRDELAYFQAYTGDDGVLLACYDQGAMVAYGLLGLRSAVVGQLAAQLGGQAHRTCVLDGAAALPSWRGVGMHQAAIEQRMAYAAAAQRTLVAATVSPSNLRSLRSLLRAGLRIRAFAEMYGGFPRLLLQRDLLCPDIVPECVQEVAAGDEGAHRAALAAGLAGYACRQQHGGNWTVLYGRPA